MVKEASIHDVRKMFAFFVTPSLCPNYMYCLSANLGYFCADVIYGSPHRMGKTAFLSPLRWYGLRRGGEEVVFERGRGASDLNGYRRQISLSRRIYNMRCENCLRATESDIRSGVSPCSCGFPSFCVPLRHRPI